MEEKYGLYIVDPSDIEGNIEDLSYDDIKDLAIDYAKEDSIEDLMRYLVNGLNHDTISDQIYLYVTDEEQGIIFLGR
jgi:hypothetical protein